MTVIILVLVGRTIILNNRARIPIQMPHQSGSPTQIRTLLFDVNYVI